MGAEGDPVDQLQQQQPPQQQPQRYSLRWNDFQSCILSSFRHLRDEEDFVDVTLACDGCSFTAHKVVLSACSPYFRRLLKSNPCQHPIVILRDVHHKDMESLLRFMYNGEVHVAQEHLTDFLKTAQLLQIRGLADVSASGATGQRLNSTSDEKISPNSTTMIPWGPSVDLQQPEALRGSPDSPPPPKRMRSEEETGYPPLPEEHSSPGDDGDLPESLLGQALETGPVSIKKEKTSIERSFQAQSTIEEDSNSSDGDAANSEHNDGATPKLEPPDYSLGMDDHQAYGTNGNISVEQARTPPFPGGLLGLQGLSGLMAGPSGIHNSQNDFVSRRSLDMMRVRATDPRPCPKCGKIYRSAHTLRTHLEDKHTVCPGYRCVLCGTVAKSRNSLHSHMSRQHRGISTKDLPVLPMPAPFDPELASRLLAKAGVKISAAELRARASPTGPRRSDVKLDAKSAYSGASETGSSICGENDPEDLTISQHARFNATGHPVAAKSMESLHSLSKEPYPAPLAPPVPGGNTTGSAILDTYLQFITENSMMAGMMNPEQAAAAMHAAKLAQLNAMGMENHTQQHFMEKMHQQMQNDYMMKQQHGDEIRRGESDVVNHGGDDGLKENEEGDESSEEEYSDDEASGPEGLKAGE